MPVLDGPEHPPFFWALKKNQVSWWLKHVPTKLQHIFEGDVQNPQKGTFTNPCKTHHQNSSQIWESQWFLHFVGPEAAGSPTSPRHGSGRTGKGGWFYGRTKRGCGHQRNMGKTWGKSPWTHWQMDLLFASALFWTELSILWLVFGSLVDISGLLGEGNFKQVVGEPKIWVMFLLEESPPRVQPLLNLIWKNHM